MTESQDRWRQRPQGSTWGDFGPDDELGRANLLGPEAVLAGVAEVREGKTFCLSLPLDYPGGAILSAARTPPVLRATRRNGKAFYNYRLQCEDASKSDIITDDRVELSTQYSTHWDALSHYAQAFDVDGDGSTRDVYYNGYGAGTDVVGPDPCDLDAPVGARRLGIENVAVRGMQGRGVMVDLHAHFGYAPHAVTYADLAEIFEKDGIVVRKGDIVCFHSGFGQLLLDMEKQPDKEKLFASSPALDGRDERLQQWVTESGVVALACDNMGVEMMPATQGVAACCPSFPLHQHCIFRLGVYLGELWYLTELATWLRAARRTSFLLTAPPLRLPGATGSPLTPIATV